MAEIRKNGTPICGHIDDFIQIKMTKAECFQSGLSSAYLFTQLGFVIHPAKSQLEPSQKITFLGFVIDSTSMTISLTEKRKNALKSLLLTALRLKRPTIRFVAKVIGHIISSLPASKYGSLFYRNLESDKINALRQNQGNFDANMSFSKKGKNELQWWLTETQNLTNWIIPPPITEEIMVFV